jgi:hypothetical protein
MIDDELEDIFGGGTPKRKFYEIMFAANRNIVSEEIDKLITKLALYEEKYGDIEIPFEIIDNVENIKTDYYISTVARIVSQNE